MTNYEQWDTMWTTITVRGGVITTQTTEWMDGPPMVDTIIKLAKHVLSGRVCLASLWHSNIVLAGAPSILQKSEAHRDAIDRETDQ